MEISDEGGFTSWESVRHPLPCLRVRQVRENRRNGQWVMEEPRHSFIITISSRTEMTPETVWRIVHLRWDIENSLLNDLKQNWSFEHCYPDDVRGIEALYELYAVAFNRRLLLTYRQLGYGRRRGPTLIELAVLFLMDFGNCRFTWREVLAWRRATRAGLSSS